MTTPYVCGIPLYDLNVTRPMEELYGKCKCGKEFEDHGKKGQHWYDPRFSKNGPRYRRLGII